MDSVHGTPDLCLLPSSPPVCVWGSLCHHRPGPWLLEAKVGLSLEVKPVGKQEERCTEPVTMGPGLTAL